MYERKSAPPKVRPAKSGAAAKKPVAKKAPVTSLAGVVTKPAAELVEQTVFTREDFRGSIDDMAGARLKAYAKSIGIQQRDVDGLSEARLRQNCKARVLDSLED
ncbi:MAG: hypothetical protein KF686_03375 [Ramlibacter sp.]|nr:hypothetical protein [Ramlibacter sp.]